MIPIAEPSIDEKERENLLKAFDSGWISSKGEFIDQFEESFSSYVGTKHGVATSNGTTALHLALTALGIGKNDEVLLPSLTFISTANAVSYTGAKPVFVDAHPDYWCMDPVDLEAKLNANTKAVMPVHLYGHPCDMDPIRDIAADNDLYIIEDAAEAHGSEYKGEKAGGLGDVGCFSFYGNKTITTGEGGMCLTDNQELSEKMKILRDHGTTPGKHYWCDVIGFNYRMTNLQAAIGCAQVNKLDGFIQKKRENAKSYTKQLKDIPGITTPPEKEWAKNTYWMYSILIKDEFPLKRDDLQKKLKEAGIDSRPLFPPIHKMPIYHSDTIHLVSEMLSKKGLNLPSSVNLSEDDIVRITDSI